MTSHNHNLNSEQSSTWGKQTDTWLYSGPKTKHILVVHFQVNCFKYDHPFILVKILQIMSDRWPLGDQAILKLCYIMFKGLAFGRVFKNKIAPTRFCVELFTRVDNFHRGEKHTAWCGAWCPLRGDVLWASRLSCGMLWWSMALSKEHLMQLDISGSKIVSK